MPKNTSKAAWIRANDTHGPSSELIAKAKREGISITRAQIYTTRAELKRRGTRSKNPQSTLPDLSAKIHAPAISASLATVDQLIRQIIRQEVAGLIRQEVQGILRQEIRSFLQQV